MKRIQLILGTVNSQPLGLPDGMQQAALALPEGPVTGRKSDAED